MLMERRVTGVIQYRTCRVRRVRVTVANYRDGDETKM